MEVGSFLIDFFINLSSKLVKCSVDMLRAVVDTVLYEFAVESDVNEFLRVEDCRNELSAILSVLFWSLLYQNN